MVSPGIWLGTVIVKAVAVVEVAVVITAVIMDIWPGNALRKAAAAAALDSAVVVAVAVVGATTAEKKDILRENALTQTHRDEGKRGVIVYMHALFSSTLS